MKAVLEDVPERHGGGREPVYKQCLQLSLDKVPHDHHESQCLQL